MVRVGKLVLSMWMIVDIISDAINTREYWDVARVSSKRFATNEYKVPRTGISDHAVRVQSPKLSNSHLRKCEII